jgi:hypothetical protein
MIAAANAAWGEFFISENDMPSLWYKDNDGMTGFPAVSGRHDSAQSLAPLSIAKSMINAVHLIFIFIAYHVETIRDGIGAKP